MHWLRMGKSTLHYFVLWIFGVVLFLCLLCLGYHVTDSETIYFYEYAPNLYKDTETSLLLVIPSILATFFLVAIILLVRIFFLRHKHRVILSFIDILPTILSSIPLFVTGIVFIRYLKLDTLYSYNFLCGILCLCLFNVSYLFNKIKKCIEEEYKKPFVAYAYSLGISEQNIFRHYILPGIIPHIFFTLRELTPHIIIESIVIEYTFSYNALLRTAIQALYYENWYYLSIFVYELVLILSFFEIICRWMQKKS